MKILFFSLFLPCFFKSSSGSYISIVHCPFSIIKWELISFSRGSRWCYDEKITPFRLTFLTLGLLHINKLCNFNRRHMYNTMFIVTKRFCFSPVFLPKTDFKRSTFGSSVLVPSLNWRWRDKIYFFIQIW